MVAARFTLSDWAIIGLAIPLSPIWAPLLCIHQVYRCIHPRISQEEKAYRNLHKNRPPPLPYSRKFNLSTTTIPAMTAPISPFLRLPYSVRCQVYECLFLNRCVIHVKHMPKRMAHTHTFYPPTWTADQHIRHNAVSETAPYPCGVCSYYLDLQLLRTCRTVYQEAHPLVYSTNTFAFRELDSLIYFNQCVRPQHLARIRYLQLDWDMVNIPARATRRPYDEETWKRVWNIIATRLTGLEAIDLSVRLWVLAFESEKSWLSEVAKIRGLKNFVLQINYPRVALYEDDGFRVDGDTMAYRLQVAESVKRLGTRRDTQARVRSQDRGRARGRGDIRADEQGGDSEGRSGTEDTSAFRTNHTSGASSAETVVGGSVRADEQGEDSETRGGSKDTSASGTNHHSEISVAEAGAGGSVTAQDESELSAPTPSLPPWTAPASLHLSPLFTMHLEPPPF
ncbi:hypothetical protein MMC13_004740 [Lambiella insularis]|nr:hypothetical protein [Lambiella insularis]